MWKVPAEEAPNIIARFRHAQDVTQSGGLSIPPAEAKALHQRITELQQAAADPTQTKTRKQRNALVRRIYDLTDDMMARVEQSIGFACSKGCSYCCSLDVEVSRVELDRLVDVLDRAPLRKKAKKAKARSYCSFLDTQTGTCSIYAERPYSCRTFSVYDHPAYCRDPMASHGVTAQNGKFVSEVFEVLLMLLVKLKPVTPVTLSTVYGHGPKYDPIIQAEELPFEPDWQNLKRQSGPLA